MLPDFDNLPPPTIRLSEAHKRLASLSSRHIQVIHEIRAHLQATGKNQDQRRLNKYLFRQLVEHGSTLVPNQMELDL